MMLRKGGPKLQPRSEKKNREIQEYPSKVSPEERKAKYEAWRQKALEVKRKAELEGTSLIDPESF